MTFKLIANEILPWWNLIACITGLILLKRARDNFKASKDIKERADVGLAKAEELVVKSQSIYKEAQEHLRKAQSAETTMNGHMERAKLITEEYEARMPLLRLFKKD